MKKYYLKPFWKKKVITPYKVLKNIIFEVTLSNFQIICEWFISDFQIIHEHQILWVM